MAARERALQPMLPNPGPTGARRTVSKAEVLAQVERIRMSAAHCLADSLTGQQRLYDVLEATAELWRAIAGEEPPEVEVSARVVRSA